MEVSGQIEEMTNDLGSFDVLSDIYDNETN